MDPCLRGGNVLGIWYALDTTALTKKTPGNQSAPGEMQSDFKSDLYLRMIANQNFAAADAVGGADDALAFHGFNNSCRSVIADLEVTLDKAGRCLAFA